MSARAVSSDQRSPCDKLAAASILSAGMRRGSSFLKPPRNLGVGTNAVMLKVFEPFSVYWLPCRSARMRIACRSEPPGLGHRDRADKLAFAMRGR